MNIIPRIFIIILIITTLLVITLSAGCSNKPAQNTLEPTQTIKTNDIFPDDFATSVQKSKSAPAQLTQKGGLGDNLHIFENAYGKPTQILMPLKDGVGMFNFQDNFIVTVNVMNGRIKSFTIQYEKKYGPGNGVSFAAAQDYIKPMLPKDAAFLNNYKEKVPPDLTKNIYVYHSKSLEGLFPAAFFFDPHAGKEGEYKQGEFGILYYVQDDGKVVGIIVATGNNF